MVRKCVFEEVKCKVVGATLLSIDEAKIVPKEIRSCVDWWWLRSRGGSQLCAAGVYYDGTIKGSGIYVYINDMCVRPAFIIKRHNLNVGDKVEIFGIKATIVSERYALVDEPITKHRFDEETNDYNKSEIKQFVDEWFDELKRNYDKEAR